MKTIKLRDDLKFKSREVIETVLTAAPQGVTVEQIRRRVRILDALDKVKDQPEMKLEDADFDLLEKTFAEFQFASAHRDFLVIADDIKAAREEGTEKTGGDD